MKMFNYDFFFFYKFTVTNILKICMKKFNSEKNNILQIYRVLNLAIFKQLHIAGGIL